MTDRTYISQFDPKGHKELKVGDKIVWVRPFAINEFPKENSEPCAGGMVYNEVSTVIRDHVVSTILRSINQFTVQLFHAEEPLRFTIEITENHPILGVSYEIDVFREEVGRSCGRGIITLRYA